MKTELASGGYEKIDARIQNIENFANSGVFASRNAVSLFQKIISEAKLLRQTLREVLLLVPDTRPADTGGNGDAA